MTAPSDLFRTAAKSALRMRSDAGYPLDQPCNVYDLIAKHGLDLQFFAVPTLEGMYLEDGKTKRICISAFRPPGRQRYTAGHEVGHFALGHGTKVDTIEELRETSSELDLEERLAEMFSSCLTMPRSAVYAASSARKIDIRRPDPAQIYRLSLWLGVGFATLVRHLFHSIESISYTQMEQLLKIQPRTIKGELIGTKTTKEVFELDGFWDGKSADGQVGDFFLGIAHTTESFLRPVHDGLFVAVAPGQGHVKLPSGCGVQVRIARENFVGFYDYRYLPEVE
jgi:Zn-dependent peptidase ImmA (M78 family)